jgi:hypothetical protein
MSRRSPRSLSAVARNETSVRKDLPDFRTQPTLPRSRLADDKVTEHNRGGEGRFARLPGLAAGYG